MPLDAIRSASDRLKSNIDQLSSAGSKSSANFLLLSEQVLAFYSLCSRYLDSLPPQVKFKLRELLPRLQGQSQSLKTYTSSPQGGRLLDEILSTNREIMTLVCR